MTNEQDAVHDAYVAQLEAALRKIAKTPALGSSIARTLDQCILIARDALGTPPMVTEQATEQDAVRDAYVAHLEATLEEIRRWVLPRGGVWVIDTITAALGTGDIARIPDAAKWPPRGEVAFTRWPIPGGEWHLIGPAVLLKPGAMIKVKRFSERDSAVVVVGQIVAERTVIHKDTGPVRYVVARLSRAVKD